MRFAVRSPHGEIDAQDDLIRRSNSLTHECTNTSLEHCRRDLDFNFVGQRMPVHSVTHPVPLHSSHLGSITPLLSQAGHRIHSSFPAITLLLGSYEPSWPPRPCGSAL